MHSLPSNLPFILKHKEQEYINHFKCFGYHLLLRYLIHPLKFSIPFSSELVRQKYDYLKKLNAC